MAYTRENLLEDCREPGRVTRLSSDECLSSGPDTLDEVFLCVFPRDPKWVLDTGVEPIDVTEVVVTAEGAPGNLEDGDDGITVVTEEVQDDFCFVDIVDEAEILWELYRNWSTLFRRCSIRKGARDLRLLRGEGSPMQGSIARSLLSWGGGGRW